MANKRVDINSGVRADVAHDARAPRPLDSSKGTNALDVSHLRPLSEGVLRATGLHGGLDHEGNVRDLRGLLDGAVALDPYDLPSDELHVQWARLEHDHEGMIERNVNADDSITLRFVYGDGDVATAKGETTRDAFGKLSAKMAKLGGSN